jgi:26S proteasome regulatory subunit T2
LERIKDFLVMEEEFIQNQERFKPQEEKTQDESTKVDDLRGSPMAVGSIEEIIDDNHAIVSSSVGPEYYVPILSFVDKDLIEPGCSVLLHNKVMAVVGILQDEVDPLVSVMKVEKAPLETYADIGGLEKQIQEIKVSLSLSPPLPPTFMDTNTHKQQTHKQTHGNTHIISFDSCLFFSQFNSAFRKQWNCR